MTGAFLAYADAIIVTIQVPSLYYVDSGGNVYGAVVALQIDDRLVVENKFTVSLPLQRTNMAPNPSFETGLTSIDGFGTNSVPGITPGAEIDTSTAWAAFDILRRALAPALRSMAMAVAFHRNQP